MQNKHPGQTTVIFAEDKAAAPPEERKEQIAPPITTVHLRPKPQKVVKWTEDTVDNENMGKLKSNGNHSLFYCFIVVFWTTRSSLLHFPQAKVQRGQVLVFFFFEHLFLRRKQRNWKVKRNKGAAQESLLKEKRSMWPQAQAIDESASKLASTDHLKERNG